MTLAGVLTSMSIAFLGFSPDVPTLETCVQIFQQIWHYLINLSGHMYCGTGTIFEPTCANAWYHFLFALWCVPVTYYNRERAPCAPRGAFCTTKLARGLVHHDAQQMTTKDVRLH